MPTTDALVKPPLTSTDGMVSPDKDDKSPAALQKHMESTYFNLRYGLLLIALVLLLVPVTARMFVGIPFQGSLSAYYHAFDARFRDIFVGALVALGALLYLYKGFSRDENYVLNLAGAFAVGVAIIPMEWQCERRNAGSIDAAS